jgi:hypothetical protein
MEESQKAMTSELSTLKEYVAYSTETVMERLDKVWMIFFHFE